MSLEKWLKSDKDIKSSKKKQEKTIEKPKIEENDSFPQRKVDSKNNSQVAVKFKKYILICTKSKCKYQKTIMKSKLSEADKICPRCNSKMKEK